MSTVNFNSNEYSPLSPEVIAAMKKAVDDFSDAATEGFGKDYKRQSAIEECRIIITENLKVELHEVFFNYGFVNAEIQIINWAALVLGVITFVTSSFENPEKLRYLKGLEDLGQIKLQLIETTEYGEISIEDFKKTLSSLNCNTIISLSHANSFSGILLPLKEVSLICKENRFLFHLNASLTIGRYNIGFQNIKPDFVSFSPSLLNGPKGIGCTIINDSIAISNKRYNYLKDAAKTTENKDIAQILGFKMALMNAFRGIESKQEKIAHLKSYFISKVINKLGIEAISTQFKKEGLYNQVAFWLNNWDYGNYIFEKLDLKGISVSSIEFPLKNKYEGYTFLNIGISDMCLKSEIDYFIEVLQKMKK